MCLQRRNVEQIIDAPGQRSRTRVMYRPYAVLCQAAFSTTLRRVADEFRSLRARSVRLDVMLLPSGGFSDENGLADPRLEELNLDYCQNGREATHHKALASILHASWSLGHQRRWTRVGDNFPLWSLPEVGGYLD